IYATTIDASRVINASNATMIPRDYLGQLILFCTFLFLFFIFMIVPAAMRIFRKYHTLMSLNERDEDHCRSHIDKFLTQFISLLSVPIAVINDAGKMTCFSESFRRLFQLDDNDEHTWELQQFLQKSHYTDLMQSGHAHEQ